MNTQERNALLAICFHAALADGGSSESEQAQVRRAVAGASDEEATAVYQDVLTGKRPAAGAAAQLLSPQTREQAFEMAVCVCAADEGLSDRERKFLEDLRSALGVPKDQAQNLIDNAQALTLAPSLAKPGTSASRKAGASVSDAELDRMIHKSAIFNGALELLPNSLATMAIVPLQMRLVYKIGKSYGYDLDRGHLKDFMATAGVGMAGQVLEKYATRLLGKVMGGFSGGLVRGAAKQATSSAFSYASTYALGQAAKQYYASDRKLSGVELKSVFEGLFQGAKKKQSEHSAEIEAEAGRVKIKDLLPSIREA